MFLKYQFLVRGGMLIFWGIIMVFPKILNILRNYAERWTISAFVGIYHTSCLLKFGQQTLNCSSISTLFLPKSFLHWALFDKIGRFFWTTLYIRKFSHESAKGFSVMSYGFILFRFHQTLTQSETIYSMQVWTLSGKVLKSLHKCERSISLIPRILVSKSMVKLFPEAAVAYIVQNSCS